MCGIFCAVSHGQPIWPSSELQHLLQHRGPDSCGTCQATVSATPDAHAQGDVHITFFSTVLSLRGDTTVHQPLQRGESRATLCWNGEAWSVNNLPTSGNDTRAVLNLLYDTTERPNLGRGNGMEKISHAKRIATQMSQITGPYAFVFHDAANNLLFFGRDFLGRRSLLFTITGDNAILISSMAGSPSTGTWHEVEADGLYCLDLDKCSGSTCDPPNMERWGRFPVLRLPYHTATDEVGNIRTAVGQHNPSASV